MAKPKSRRILEILPKNPIRVDTSLDWAELSTELEIRPISEKI